MSPNRLFSLFTSNIQKIVALLTLLSLAAVGSQGQRPSRYAIPEQNRAIYLGWQGYVDTQLDFSQFFDSDHTIAGWFMPQYPYAYEGPIFAENGAGTYTIGQGNYRDGDGGLQDPGEPVLQIQIGNQKVLYLVPEFKESALEVHPWVHIAVVRRNDIFSLFINASLQTPVKIIDKMNNTTIPDSEIDASSIPSALLPSGTLRFGRRTSEAISAGGPSPDTEFESKREWQTYGLLDDVAVFDKALNAIEIFYDILYQKRLSGSESGLIAGWCFDQPAPGDPPLPPLLNSWWDPSPRAYKVPVAPDRDSDYDDRQFDNPLIIGETQVALTLPIPIDEEWYVVQGYNARGGNSGTPGGSHNGTAAFSYDFRLNEADPKTPKDYPNGTANAPVLTSSPGKAILYNEGSVTFKHAEGEYVRYLHLAENSLDAGISGGVYDPVKKWYIIPEGQAPYFQQDSQVAEVDPTEYHLHWAGKGGLLMRTIPMAFSNYEVLDEESQTWVHVLRGHPKAGQVIKRLY